MHAATSDRTNRTDRPTDTLLLPFLCASDDAQARGQLDQLLHHHAEPIIAGVLRRQRRNSVSSLRGFLGEDPDAPDVHSEALVSLITRLQEMRNRPDATSIGDFHAYVKVTARHACQRQAGRRRRECALPTAAVESGVEELAFELPDPRVDIAQQACRRDLLREVWDQILLLPPRQRAALLLNLRDGSEGDALPLIVALGIATEKEVATALTLSEEELSPLLDALPLEDSVIAERFGISRREVINLRVSARRRLERRLEGALKR